MYMYTPICMPTGLAYNKYSILEIRNVYFHPGEEKTSESESVLIFYWLINLHNVAYDVIYR